MIENSHSDFENNIKALEILFTMRSNLAMLDSLTRQSIINDNNIDVLENVQLNFLGYEKLDDQIAIHNQSIYLFTTAFLYQIVDNYLSLKTIKPELEDSDIEMYFDKFEDKNKLIRNLRGIRNSVFHITNLNQMNRNRSSFFDSCAEMGGFLVVIQNFRKLFYEYTEKCFQGKLKIFPNEIYEISKDFTDELNSKKFENHEEFNSWFVKQLDNLLKK